jgi:hypothetical protein
MEKNQQRQINELAKTLYETAHELNLTVKRKQPDKQQIIWLLKQTRKEIRELISFLT